MINDYLVAFCAFRENASPIFAKNPKYESLCDEDSFQIGAGVVCSGLEAFLKEDFEKIETKSYVLLSKKKCAESNGEKKEITFYAVYDKLCKSAEKSLKSNFTIISEKFLEIYGDEIFEAKVIHQKKEEFKKHLWLPHGNN